MQKNFHNFITTRGVDEIFYQDVVATLYGQNNLLKLIKNTAKNIFVPLIVGGGIRDMNDIYNIINSGADRICANSSFIKNRNFIKEAVKEFGSSTICANIEAVKLDNDYFCFYENGRTNSGLKVVDWVKILEDHEIGEIFLTFVDFDGRGKGIDEEFLNFLNKNSNVSIIPGGGIGNTNQIVSLKKKTKDLSGICLASLLHYNCFKDDFFLNEINFEKGNYSFFKNNSSFLNFEKINLKDLKLKIFEENIKVRI